MTSMIKSAGRATFALTLLSLFAIGLVNSASAAEEYDPYGVTGGKYGDTHSLFTTSEPNIFYHNVGLLELFVSNIGRVGNGQLGLDSFSAGWKGGEYLYIGAMWIGAIASDNLAYVSTGGYEFELLPSNDQVDTIYPAYEGVAGGNRPGFSPVPDDDRDGTMDEEFLNGRDDDGDGLIDEDFAAVSQQMFSCEYWDYTENAINRYPEHRPLNVRVQQTSFSWSTEGSNEFVGFDFNIVNDGFEVLRQVYLGFFVDSDAGPRDVDGYWTDDGVALYSTDTTFVDTSINFTCQDETESFDCAVQNIHMDIMYMYDIPDDGETATGGDVDGFFGGMFLGHTTDPVGELAPAQVQMHTARFFSGNNPYPAGDPRNDSERYDLLQSGERSERPSTQPNDYRYTFAAGPFAELLPGDELRLQVAFVVGQGRQGMITNALNAQRIYNGRWRNVDGNTQTGIDGRETCLVALEQGVPRFWRDPCDSLNPSSLTIKDLECLPQNYVDNDCDCCTPLQPSPNEVGLETLVHWVGTVAPPPPGTSIDLRGEPGIDFVEGQSEIGVSVTAPEGDRAVIVQWDNLSELTADPIQAKILFTGYRVWRVEGWNRPTGSVGPGPEQWQLVADLSLDPADGLGEASPYYLLNYAESGFDTTACLENGNCYRAPTGATLPTDEDGNPIEVDPAEAWRYESERAYVPHGIYQYSDTLGIKNGMLYFYDITAYSAWQDSTGLRFELESLPSATESEAVIPRWSNGSLDDVFVVPNPYILNANPPGWDLTPSDRDPTGTKIAFANLPEGESTIKIYTLSGDLVQTIQHDGSGGNGTAFWPIVSRNGQQVVSGVYIFSVTAGNDSKVGRFVIIR